MSKEARRFWINGWDPNGFPLRDGSTIQVAVSKVEMKRLASFEVIEYAEYKKAIEKLHSCYCHDHKLEITRLKEENRRLAELAQGLKQENKILKNPSDGRCMEIGALRAHRDELTKKLEAAESRIVAREDELFKANEIIPALKAAISGANYKAAVVTKELQAANARIDELKQKLEASEARAKQLEIEYDELNFGPPGEYEHLKEKLRLAEAELTQARAVVEFYADWKPHNENVQSDPEPAIVIDCGQRARAFLSKWKTEPSGSKGQT